MTEKLLQYFNYDELSASVWEGKYALKNEKGEVVETTPYDMHLRMAKELARTEKKIIKDLSNIKALSDMAKSLPISLDTEFILYYLDKFKWIIPQGSIMSGLGNKYKIQSLSNCFTIPSPVDSYGGIFKTDQEIAQLEKRRGGVGTSLNTLRPEKTIVLNSAGTSTGAHSFMERYSNTTREVGQDGRRGALMLLMLCLHPDIFKFVTKKQDRTKVTGANISSQLTNKFMEAVKADADFLCKFPVNLQVELDDLEHVDLPYNELVILDKELSVMRIHAKELFDLIVEMAWKNAEPGVAFMDRVINYSPEGVYEQYRAEYCNPCGEQFMQAYDACRLLAANLFSLVTNPYRENASLDLDRAYEVFYIQQRLADDIVDLEIEYVDRIINKIKSDPESDEIKAVELKLWENVKTVASSSRRTGCGFTALGDMLAALNLKYDSEEALDVTKTLMQTKMRAELDCTIDLAILRGTFVGWDREKEIGNAHAIGWFGMNDFYEMLLKEFNPQVQRMYKYGRRNINWSTEAPTGSLSIMAILSKYSNTSGGIEPIFLPYYFRNKKINPSDKNMRTDFVDQNGDSWQTYPVVMGGFKEWYDVQIEENADFLIMNDYGDVIPMDFLTKDQMDYLFKHSPYYESCANDISWKKRIEMQCIIQKYTTNAISSTLNLPKDVSKSTISNIYMEAWEQGLKGVTVYRDGCRTGVMVTEANKSEDTIVYNDAPKRPKELKAELNIVTVKGAKYAIIVGFLDNKPYEIFAFTDDENIINTKSKGSIIKDKKLGYCYISDEESRTTIPDINGMTIRADEQMLTRLVSGMMRHGVNPKFIYEQINKCPLEVVSFGKAINRVIKRYVSEDALITGKKCSECNSTNIRLEEGCSKCMDCGSSKC